MKSVHGHAYGELLACLRRKTCEEDVQVLLQRHPHILLDTFVPAWAERWIFPKFRLGDRYVTDFLMVSRQSLSYDITLVELEQPWVPLYTRATVTSKWLNHARRQINEWHTWLTANRSYFLLTIERCANARILDNGGRASDLAREVCLTGPMDLPVMVFYKIVIGRSHTQTREQNEQRAAERQRSSGSIEIVTYDRLLSAARTHGKSKS